MALWKQLSEENQKTNLIVFGLLLIFFGSILALSGAMMGFLLKSAYSLVIYFFMIVIVELGMLFLSLVIMVSAILDKNTEPSVKVAFIGMVTAMIVMLLIMDIIYASIMAVGAASASFP